MKLLVTGWLTAGLVLASGAVYAGSAREAGKTVGHATGSVGHGISKLYHEAAKGVHKTIAKNTHNPHRKAYHMEKAEEQRYEAHHAAQLSHKEMRHARQHAK